ncbi:C repressor [Pseudanabaena phage Pam5]|nr:C repressor [Pseudanabaena phage Pam5]
MSAQPLSKLLKDRGFLLRDLAAAAKVDKATVTRWAQKRVPAERVLMVESLMGISRHDLRPDIYGPAKREGAAA